MSVNRQTHPIDNSNRRFIGRYFTFNKSLFYVEDISLDGKMALVEDCKEEDLEWVSVELFKKGMKEVKC